MKIKDFFTKWFKTKEDLTDPSNKTQNANIEDEELDDETIDFIFGVLWARSHKEEAKEMTAQKIRTWMEEGIMEILNSHDIDDPMLGLMVECDIANSSKTFKEDQALSQLSGLDKLGYEDLVDAITTEMFNKYLEH